MINIKALVPVLTKAFDCRLVQREFSGRQQVYLRYLFDSALCFGIESTKAVDFVIQQVDAVGQI